MVHTFGIRLASKPIQLNWQEIQFTQLFTNNVKLQYICNPDRYGSVSSILDYLRWPMLSIRLTIST